MHLGPVNPPARPLASPPPWAALVLVAVAFGIVEAAIVTVYRTQFDPAARFPLLALPSALAGLERVREASTLLLLGGVACAACRPAAARAAAFFFLFGLWDIAYYISLRATLGWPQGPNDWDLLFLLPVPWLGPVAAPLLLSCVLIVVGVVVLRHEERRGPFRVHPLHVLAAIVAGLLCTWSFVENADARALLALPSRYAFEYLALGLGIGGAAFIDALRRNR